MVKASICAEVLNGTHTGLWAPREEGDPDAGSEGGVTIQMDKEAQPAGS